MRIKLDDGTVLEIEGRVVQIDGNAVPAARTAAAGYSDGMEKLREQVAAYQEAETRLEIARLDAMDVSLPEPAASEPEPAQPERKPIMWLSDDYRSTFGTWSDG